MLNNLFIREGIWPVSPFSSPELYQYIQGLPVHFRANKNILRAFHKAKGFTELIYNAKENEYFDVFFGECFARGTYDHLLETLLPMARTVDMGYVDVAKIKEAYCRTKHNPTVKTDLQFRLYCFLSLEISLHLSGAKLGLGRMDIT